MKTNLLDFLISGDLPPWRRALQVAMKRLHLVQPHELRSPPTVYEPARFRTEGAELHSSLAALTPPEVRHALLSRAIHRARLRMAERDEMDRGRTGAYLRNENLTSSFNGGLLLRPMLECPLDLVKTVSARRQWDGGKWLCGLRSLVSRSSRSCTVFSFGSNLETSFEERVQQERRKHTGSQRAGCDVHIFDPTLKHRKGYEHFEERVVRDGVGKLHDVGLTGGNASVIELRGRPASLRPLKALIEQHAPNRCIDILKFDVEGHELSVLRQTPWSQLCIGMLLFELHPRVIERSHAITSARARFGYTPGGASGALADIRRTMAS